MSRSIGTPIDTSDLRPDTVPSGRLLLVYQYPIQCMLFVLSLFIATLLSILPIERWETMWFWTVVIYGTLAIILPWIASFIFRKSKSTIGSILDALDLSEDQALIWLSGQFTFIFGNRWAYVVGVVLSVAAVWSTEVLGHPWSGTARILLLALIAILFVFIGVVGWSYLGLLLFINNLKNLPVKGEPFNWPERSFRQLNSAYLQMFTAGAFIYLVSAMGVWLSPGGQALVLGNPITQLWIFPIALVVISFFLAFQYAIHRMMAQSKQHRLDHLNRLLTSQFEEWTANPVSDKGRAVSDLIAWQDHIKQEADWPLDFKSILLIISGLLLPTIKNLIDLVNI